MELYTTKELEEMQKEVDRKKNESYDNLMALAFASGTKVKIRRPNKVDKSGTVITINIVNPTPTLDDTVRVAVETKKGLKLIELNILSLLCDYKVIQRKIIHRGLAHNYYVLSCTVNDYRYSFYIPKCDE